MPSHVAEQSDEELAALAAREGSNGLAFGELVRRFKDRVWRICYRLMGNEHDAHDAAQEVFTRLFFQRHKFAGASKYSTWVHGVAVRTCLTLRRSRGRRQRRVGEIADETLARHADRHDAGADASISLAEMLDTLDEDDRALLILKYAESYDYEELAEMFGISVSACKMRISRAREKLNRRFPDAL